ncbi:hypothetical protein V8F33_014168 [Rhypophila sp. PSN 637]
MAQEVPTTSTPGNLTAEEESHVFKIFKGFLFSERNNETRSWVWDYGLDVQSTTERKWVCVPCIGKKESRPASYEYKGTQNAENHLWKAHGYWDPTGKRTAPSTKKGGKRVFASASDFWQLNRHDPKEQATTIPVGYHNTT